MEKFLHNNNSRPYFKILSSAKFWESKLHSNVAATRLSVKQKEDASFTE